jgi:hypothetical protein
MALSLMAGSIPNDISIYLYLYKHRSNYYVVVTELIVFILNNNLELLWLT